MSIRKRTVIVRQLPQALNAEQGRIVLSELEECLSAERPRIVFDCSKLRHMDRSGVLSLLSCLEEALKQNGDVRLAAVPASLEGILEVTGAARLFAMFDSISEAIDSFARPKRYAGSLKHFSEVGDNAAENAA